MSALIYGKMAEAMSMVSHIGKDRNNQGQGYKYRGVDDVMNELHNIFVKCKIFPVPTLIDLAEEERVNKNGSLLIYKRIKYSIKFYAEDGSYVEAIAPGEGMDSGDKSSAKACSSAYKTIMLQVFSIPTDEPKDTEIDSPEPEPKKVVSQAKQPASKNTAIEAQVEKTFTDKKKATAQVIDLPYCQKWISDQIKSKYITTDEVILCYPEGKDEFTDLTLEEAKAICASLLPLVSKRKNGEA